jgi:hypothetical protein
MNCGVRPNRQATSSAISTSNPASRGWRGRPSKGSHPPDRSPQHARRCGGYRHPKGERSRAIPTVVSTRAEFKGLTCAAAAAFRESAIGSTLCVASRNLGVRRIRNLSSASPRSPGRRRRRIEASSASKAREAAGPEHARAHALRAQARRDAAIAIRDGLATSEGNRCMFGDRVGARQ